MKRPTKAPSFKAKAKRELRKLERIGQSKMSDFQRSELNARKAQTGTLVMFAENNVTRQIETKKAPASPDMGSIVKLFG